MDGIFIGQQQIELHFSEHDFRISSKPNFIICGWGETIYS